MELFQLEYFRAVVQYQSFTKAAEKLNITQPALSKAVARLESEIGMQLFDRKGNRISVNTFGRMFLSRAEKCLSELSDGVREVRELGGLERGEIYMGISETVVFPYLIEQFLTAHPEGLLNIQLQTPVQLKENLLNGKLDFAISAAELTDADILWTPLYHDRMSVMLPQSHPLAGRSSLYLDELRDERFVIGNSVYGNVSYIKKLCASAGFSPNILLESYTYDLNGVLTAKGLAISLAPYSVTYGLMLLENNNDSTANEVSIVPIADELAPQTIGIARKSGHYSSLAAQALYAQVVEYYTQKLPQVCQTPRSSADISITLPEQISNE